MPRKITTQEFIKRSNQVHKNKYRYINTVYSGSHTKIIITCPIHGDFIQRANAHLEGEGCPKCGGVYKSDKDDFIMKAKKIHGEIYDYSKVEYKNAHTKVEIICPKHGSFWQTPNNHLSGRKCKICRGLYKLNTKEFILRAREKHNNKYVYSKVKYVHNKFKVEIICPKHGSFWQTPSKHLSGQGCPKCNKSQGETKIIRFLENNKIKYIPQYSIKGCKNKNPLLFDFAIFNNFNNLVCLIEYQGIQHFKPIKKFGGLEKFKNTQKRDKIKYSFCKTNKIKLYYIKYTEDVEKELNKILNIKGGTDD